MKTHIITVLNEKGGVAKTATVLSLAGAFREVGKPVTLYDADPQASLYMLSRSIPNLECERVTVSQIESLKIADGTAIIDTPSRLDEETRAALKVCDLAIIACACEFEAAQQLERTVQFAQVHAPGKWRILLTRFDSRLRHAKEVEALVRATYPDHVYEVIIRETTALKDAHAMGGTIFDHFPRSTAAEGYRALAQTILS